MMDQWWNGGGDDYVNDDVDDDGDEDADDHCDLDSRFLSSV